MWSAIIKTTSSLSQASHASLAGLRSSVNHVHLPFSPTELTTLDVILILCILLFRSIVSVLGFSSKSSTGKGDKLSLPSLSISLPLHIKQADVRNYFVAAHAHTSSIDTNPSDPTSDLISQSTISPHHLPLLLSALSEPAAILILACQKCPINPVGAVNVRNRFEVLDAGICNSIVTDWSTSHDLSVTASLPVNAKPVKRGREIDITISILLHRVPGDYDNTQNDKHQARPAREVFRQVFTILEFMKHTSNTSRGENNPSISTRSLKSSQLSNTSTASQLPASPVTFPAIPIRIKFTNTDPLKWARVCKDYNPIHTSWLAARTFGFPGIIAHGNHVVARAVEQLSRAGSLGSASALAQGADKRDESGRGSYYMEVHFKRPVVVPGEIGVRLTHDGSKGPSHRSRLEFEVFVGEKVMVETVSGQL